MEALETKEKANDFFKAKKYIEAIELYKLALEQASCDDNLQATIYKNLSLSYFNL